MRVRLLWLSGRALAAQARGVLGSTPSNCQLFHFPLFLPHHIQKFQNGAIALETQAF